MSKPFLKTKAVVLNHKNELEIKEIAMKEMRRLYRIPKEFVHVRSKFTGVCGSDFHKIRLGGFGKQVIFGHECVAIRKKRTYVVNPLIPCKRCKYCLEGYDNLCMNMKSIGLDYPGGFSEYFYLPEENLSEIAWNDMVYVLLDAFCSVYHGLMLCRTELERAGNDEATIIGDGPVGILTSFLLDRIFKFHRIKLVGKHSLRSRILEELLNAETEFVPFSESLKDTLRNTSAFAVEAVGGSSDESFLLAISMVRPLGIILVYGVFDPFRAYEIPMRELFSKEVSCIGSRSYTSQEFKDSLILFRNFRKDLANLSSHMQMIDIDSVCSTLESGHNLEWKDMFLKLVIDFGERHV